MSALSVAEWAKPKEGGQRGSKVPERRFRRPEGVFLQSSESVPTESTPPDERRAISERWHSRGQALNGAVGRFCSRF